MKATTAILLILSLSSRIHHVNSSTDNDSSMDDGINNRYHHLRTRTTSDTANPTNINEHYCGDGLCSSSNTLQETTTNCPQDCSNIQLTTTTTESSGAGSGSKGSAGLIYSIKSTARHVVITSINIYTRLERSDQLVQVYTRLGDYAGYELSEDGWELVYDNATIDLNGRNTPTRLEGLNVSLSPGTIRSFFMVVPIKIRYDKGSEEGSVYLKDDLLEVYEGVGVRDIFSGNYTEDVFSPRVFTGTITYDVLSTTQSAASSTTTSSKQINWRPISESPTKQPTALPSSSPSQQPTTNPTTRPTNDPIPNIVKKISFVAMGDIPYTKNQRYCLNKQLRDLNQTDMNFKFIAHVGDIKWGKSPCYESSFSDVAEILSHPTNARGYDVRDVLVVPGDNEWVNCQDPDMAWRWWMKYFGNGNKRRTKIPPNINGFGTLSDPNITVQYDTFEPTTLSNNEYSSSSSNFAFFTNQSLFVGINQVGDGTHGDESIRVRNNFEWVKFNMAKYHSQQMRAVVVFGHATIVNARRQYFGLPFMKLLRMEYPEVVVLYVHGDGHTFDVNRPDVHNPNLYQLEVDGGEEADPLLISIVHNTVKDEFSFNIDVRSGYYYQGCQTGNVDKTWSSDY